MNKALVRSTQNLRKSQALLRYRRLNWTVVTKHLIKKEFESYIAASREAQFPFKFYIQHHGVPNEEQIQISVQPSKLGIIEQTYRALERSEPCSVFTPIETGGALVASQSATGFVLFIVHPRFSDRVDSTKKELLLFRPLDPAEITPRLLEKVMRLHLLLLQDSSLIGSQDALAFSERIEVWWLYFFRELRNRHEFYRSGLSLRNEWVKTLVTLALGYFFGSGSH